MRLAQAAVREATEARLASVRADIERRRNERAAIRDAIRASAAGLTREDVLLSTTPEVPGYRVVFALDVVASEKVLGVGLLGDVFSAIRDIAGGADGTTASHFARARQDCLDALRAQAAALGATAVIGVSLDYGELTAQGKSGVYIGASGTAVVVEPLTTVDSISLPGSKPKPRSNDEL